MGLVKRTYVDGETVITAANLNDIQDEIIQNASDISTKGTYSKPTGGIPKTDLASAVQTSLEKADTALQSSDIDNTLTVTGKAADAKKTGDEISGVKNTLSHKADVIYDTASGDIASFPDGADGLPVKDLTVAIEPVQDTSGGDPSPTHICPISGWTGANVSRMGINLFDKDSAWTSAGNYILNDSGVQTSDVNSSYYLEKIAVKPGTDYYFSFGGNSAPGLQRVYFYDKDENFISRTSSYNSPRAVTMPDNCYFIQLQYRQSSVDITAWMINYPATDTDYHAYQGTTIPISWQSSAGAVYGGTLDVTSGVLTVDKAYEDAGSKTWTYVTSTPSQPYFNCSKDNFSGAKRNANAYLICSFYKNSESGYWEDKTIYQTSNAIRIADTNYTSADSFMTSISGMGICYELADPVEVSLTSAQLTTLRGENNVWADCGPSTVEYPADTKLYVSKKMEEIENLRKTIAPIEDGDTASKLYGQGRYFFRNGNFCKAKTDILQNAQFTLNTNYEVTTVANELYDAINPFSV